MAGVMSSYKKEWLIKTNYVNTEHIITFLAAMHLIYIHLGTDT